MIRKPIVSHLTLQVRGVVWRVMDFTVRVPASMCVFELKSLIEQRHGGTVTDFTLYKEEVHPTNKLSDPSTPISELDFAASGPDEPRIFYYDFAPRVNSCPLLLREGRDLRVEALQKAEQAEREAKAARYAALKGGSGALAGAGSGALGRRRQRQDTMHDVKFSRLQTRSKLAPEHPLKEGIDEI